MKKKSLEPLFLFESKIRKVLLSQYSLEIIERVEKIFSYSPPIDLSIKSSASEENYFKKLKGICKFFMLF